MFVLSSLLVLSVIGAFCTECLQEISHEFFEPYKQKRATIGGLIDPEMATLKVNVSTKIGEVHQRAKPFTQKQKQAILDKHNYYRRSMSPPASNMRLMTWDSHLERTAQQWADNCVFDHGMPPGADKEKIGQNLYMGSMFEGWKDGLRAVILWYNETHDYDFESNKCREGKGVQCGHYTQLVWDASHLLGCAIGSCSNDTTRTPWMHVVCHYSPAGNFPRQPYSIGAPCSTCDSIDSGFCKDKLCVAEEECKPNCECPLKCHNCGALDKKKCRCRCKRGYDALDCSRTCQDSHEWCRMNPGFPNRDSCRKLPVQREYCRLMCDQCLPLPHGYFPKPFYHPDITGESGKKADVCCGGMLCSTGYVLDTDFCQCVLLCPGPKCCASTYRHPIKMVATGLLIWLFVWLRRK